MPRYKMITFTKPVPGREQEYHDWYNNVHLQEVTSTKGVKSGQRYRLALNVTNHEELLPFFCIYELETDDLGALLKDMQAKVTVRSEALDTTTSTLIIYGEFGEVVYKK